MFVLALLVEIPSDVLCPVRLTYYVRAKTFALNQVEWICELDLRSLGMVASRMLTNYLKSKEREEAESRAEDEDLFDPSYLEVPNFVRRRNTGWYYRVSLLESF